MKLQSNKKRKLLKIGMLIPLAFLLMYHASKLYNVQFGDDFVNSNDFLNSFNSDFSVSTILTTQRILRIIILLSISLVVLKKKIGIIGMWLGIGCLVLSQFYIASESTSQIIQSAHSGLKPLKGLILPTIITYTYRKLTQIN